jgi:hypothetical protein
VVKTPGGKLVVHHLKKQGVSWLYALGSGLGVIADRNLHLRRRYEDRAEGRWTWMSRRDGEIGGFVCYVYANQSFRLPQNAVTVEML